VAIVGNCLSNLGYRVWALFRSNFERLFTGRDCTGLELNLFPFRPPSDFESSAQKTNSENGRGDPALIKQAYLILIISKRGFYCA